MSFEQLTRRERAYIALNHKETDRVPIDFGGKFSGIAVSAYNELKQLLKIPGETEIMDMRLQLAKVDEKLLERFQVDTRYIYQKPAASWDPRWNGDLSYTDEWGITLARPSEGFYYDYVKSPLADAEDISEIEKHAWPNVEDPTRNEGLVEEVAALVKAKTPFVVTSFKGTFEQAWALRGFEEFLVDLLINREFAEVLLDKVFEVQKKLYGGFFELLEPYLDMVCFTDDLGGQLSPLVSPEVYRELIKPRHIEMVKFIKEKTNDKMVGLHSCGSVVKFLPDFCEVGFNAINPVQVTASGMDINVLKDEFGDKISFWGGIDTQQLLPFGKPEEVRRAVKETCRVLGKGGGYLFAPAHDIQAQTPAENILALFEDNLEP